MKSRHIDAARLLALVALVLFALTGLACSTGDPGERQFLAQPTAIPAEPPPFPPPPPPGAERIALGERIVGELALDPSVPASCPKNDPYGPFPCRHFEVVAPAPGVLGVEATWQSTYLDGGIGLTVAGVQQTLPHLFLQVATHRVIAGATYGITVRWAPSHNDHNWGGGQTLGKFTLTTGMQVR
jgi:hypothetical protein